NPIRRYRRVADTNILKAQIVIYRVQLNRWSGITRLMRAIIDARRGRVLWRCAFRYMDKLWPWFGMTHGRRQCAVEEAPRLEQFDNEPMGMGFSHGRYPLLKK